MRVLLLVSAFNAEQTLGELISRASNYLSVNDMLVVDDGSTDGTRDVAKGSGAMVLSHEINLGKGEALKTGFAYAIAKNYDAVITIDADLQHPPELIPEFIRAGTSADIVLGCRRFSLKTMPPDRLFSNTMTSLILSILLRKRIPDSQCGYRLIKTAPLKAITLRSSRFELESELIIRFARARYKFAFVEIPVIYNKEKSKIKRFSDTMAFISLILREIFRKQ
jgi:glycosyltransferase involved in cell wall biosynthesis